MTYYTARNLADSMRTVRKNTLIVAEDIPEEKYSFRATPETRSVADLLRHIVSSNRFGLRVHAEEKRKSFEGFNFPQVMAEFVEKEKALQTKKQIIDALQQEGEKWASFVEKLSEAELAERIAFPQPATPPTKSRFEMLLSQKEHEMHHRGQLMVLERMIGITPHLTREREARAEAARRS